ncbi:MAG: TerC family protein [Pseudobdellovibrionaceae bacterium]
MWDLVISFAMLSLMEIVLGIDNIIFISILADRLPTELRDKARRWGLAGAFVSRLVLLSMIAWIAKLTTPLFTAFDIEFAGRNLVLLLGGLFLIYKATKEIHHKVEGGDEDLTAKGPATFSSVIMQIMILDMVFSLDSVITAVGMVQSLGVMVGANIVALGVMLVLGGTISRFINRHPTVKILALSFLLVIGLALVGEGLALHIPKGYIYFAMGFSIFVEVLNLRSGEKKRKKKALS